MNNKYKINTNWSREGDRLVYHVIMDLANELNKSLKTPMMKQSKSNEEVRKILDNPEGVTIEELQVIDVWKLTRELRIEVRSKLDWAYHFLSTNLTQLIAERNSMPNRALEKNTDIDNKNRELKNTIIKQYEEVEKVIADYELKKENLGENESKRKLLTYIRKVYLQALREIIEKLFSTAASETERAKIFPLGEQKETLDKINKLKSKIRLLTRENKNKQRQKKEQEIQELQQQIAQLQKEEGVAKTARDTYEEKLKKWVDNFGSEVEVAKNRLDIAERERDNYRNERDATRTSLSTEESKNEQLQKQLDDLKSKELETVPPKLDSEARKQIQAELEKIDKIKIAEVGEKELAGLLSKLKEMKNEWTFAGNKEQQEASLSQHSQLKTVTDKLSLEACRRKWRRIINEVLEDKDNEGKEWQLKLSRFDLAGAEYVDFANTLKDLTKKREIDEFGSKMVAMVSKQRQIYFDLEELFVEGEEIITNQEIEEAQKFLIYLEYFQKLAEKNEEEELIFYKKINEITELEKKINSLIQVQQQAQVEQSPK